MNGIFSYIFIVFMFLSDIGGQQQIYVKEKRNTILTLKHQGSKISKKKPETYFDAFSRLTYQMSFILIHM